MEHFLERHRDQVIGVLHGFDRVIFRGTLRSLSYVKGMDKFLGSQRVLYKDFGPFAQKLSDRIKADAQALAAKHQRPFRYLPSAGISKEQVAREIKEADGIKEGLICVLSCVEPCMSFSVRSDRVNKKIWLVAQERKCLFLYFYYLDREFGFMHVRLQTWLPFPIQVYINGREFLARKMDCLKVGYERRDNCFAWIADLPKAQEQLDSLVNRKMDKWVRFLDILAHRVNPWIDRRSGLDLRGYYWTIREGEYATDVMFADEAGLRRIYPRLVGHAMQHFSCQDILRFLGHRTNCRFNGEVTSDIQVRQEGVRIKHRVDENSIKMYDKEGIVLRIEMTINNPRRFKVRREVTRKGQQVMGWIPMRKGLADMMRRVEICRAANERYLEALSVVGQPSPTRQVLDPVSQGVVREGRPYRGLRPISPQDAELFRVLLRGEFMLQGFRNKDLRAHLGIGQEADPIVRRRSSGWITRWLRLLRAHGLVRKVSWTRYYRVTLKGQQVMTTALKLRDLDVTALAA